MQDGDTMCVDCDARSMMGDGAHGPLEEGIEIANNGNNRVVAIGGDWPYFDAVRADVLENGEWKELFYWSCDEWRERGNEAFEAILGCIKIVAAGDNLK
jgi:hypothetical protein